MTIAITTVMRQQNVDENDESDFDKWNSSDLSYFNLLLNKSHDEEDVITLKKNVYYWNVILFVERIRNLANVKNFTIVRNNINTALRDSTLKWYTFELFNLKKIKLRFDDNDVKKWCFAFIVRFKKTIEVALIKLTSEKYIVHDARIRRELAFYVQIVVKHVKSVDIDDIKN